MATLEATLNRMKADLAEKRSKPGYVPTILPDFDGVCPLCKGKLWIFYQENGLEMAKPCECQDKAILSKRLRFADIPAAYKDLKLNPFNIHAYQTIDGRNLAAIAAKTVKYYLDNFPDMQSRGMGLYFFSNVKGSGKTRMAAGIANELLKSHQVKFAVSTTIIREIKRTWERSGAGAREEGRQNESQLLDALGMTEILIIDDFGTEQVAPWINDRFYQIINDRYVNKKVTIFTSNVKLEKLQYDDRITNRILESTYQIHFPEESIRGYIAKKNTQEMIQNLKGDADGET
ncbi:DNA replication protein [Hungatella hathewayi]|uniref:DNA replication protein n=1 Tax=Hungatella hathewayi TaxID=154046 RepID=A0AA37N670_9FIRM|nr:ATP-binding protein [Hungatella hathewayi]GKG99080.1 DNA replication protein [Hungatella hathewayi]GKH05904.1 DNA replication protein [Hungatella hathewayi]